MLRPVSSNNSLLIWKHDLQSVTLSVITIRQSLHLINLTFFSFSVLYLEYNYALASIATQKSTYNDRNDRRAELAVDGDLLTRSSTHVTLATIDQWWKVDLGTEILLRAVNVYVRDGKCISGSIDCCKFASIGILYNDKFFWSEFYVGLFVDTKFQIYGF